MSETAHFLIPAGPEHTPAYVPLGELRRAVLHGVAAETSRRKYGLALDELSAFCETRQEPISPRMILEFRAALLDRNLSPSTINVKLAAVRKLIDEDKRAALLGREEACEMADIPNVRQNGIRLGNWLTKEQAKVLLVRSSIQTTERYLGAEQKLAIAVNDRLGL